MGANLALLRKKFGAHLNAQAQRALANCRSFPPASSIRNPLTRGLVKKMAEADWRATLSQIDFDYSVSREIIAGVPCARLTTPNANSGGPVILYLHAGAFFAGSAEINAAGVLPTCRLSGCEAVAVDFSLAPNAVFPTQLEEIERVYLGLLDKTPANRIVVVGDSSGATMSAASLIRWRRQAIPPPAGLALISAPLDAAASSDTYVSLHARDPLFTAHGENGCRALFQLYAGGADCANPEISPLNGDLDGFPPTLLQVGTREILLGDTVRFAEKARSAGIDVTLQVFDGMFHLFHMQWSLAEAKAAQAGVAAFVLKVTDRR